MHPAVRWIFPEPSPYNPDTRPFYTILKSFRKTSFSVYLPDGSRCRGAYYPGSTSVVGIHVHGFRSSVAHTKARFFVDHALGRRHSWANFDLPCHGRSEGAFRTFRVSAALAALTEVIHQFRGAPVLLLGSSLGAWLSMLAARKLAKSPGISIAGAVLIAPAFDFFRQYCADESDQAMQRWRREGVRRFTDHYDHRLYELEYALVEDALDHSILERPGAWDFPIRIFHGDQDEIVPISLSHRFREASVGADIKVHAIAGGDHALNGHLPLIAATIDEMFERVEKPQMAEAV